MFKTLKDLLKIKAAHQVNVFIYYFKRIWLIGKILPDTVYQDTTLKTFVMVIATIWKYSFDLLKTAFYVGIMFVLPISIAIDKYSRLEPHGFTLFVSIYFCLNYLIGGLLNARIFHVTDQKYIAIKFMKLDPQKYVRADMTIHIIRWILFSTPIFLFATVFYGAPLWYVPILLVTYLATKLIMEALVLLIYEKKELVLNPSHWFSIVFMVVIFILAYIPLVIGHPIPVDRFVFHPVTVVLTVVLGAVSSYYLFVGYSGYSTEYVRTVNVNAFEAVIKEELRKASFKDVALAEKDTRNISTGEFDRLTGYRYLNAIFFKRNRRQLLKSVFYRMMFILVSGVSIIIICQVDPEQVGKISQQIYLFVGIYIFILYGFSIGNKATRSMFYNADISLLRYGFYRKPNVILENFKIRLTKVLIYNTFIALAFIVVTVAFQIVYGGPIWTLEMLAFYLVLLVFSFFLSIHHLFLYYVFQPYSTELQVKNPFYVIIDNIMYAIILIGMQIQVNGIGYALAILVLTIIYSSIALFLVYRLAPKYFRVK